jgi:hypothetical protein
MAVPDPSNQVDLSPMAKKPKQTEVELHPDAWARFERAADVVATSPPQHRVAKKKKTAAKKQKSRTD